MLLQEKIKDTRVILASGSPRRQFLLGELGIDFQVRLSEVEEDFPAHLKREEIPVFLAEKKSLAGAQNLADDELLITADTIVWIDGRVLNKPANPEEALEMLRQLSGKMHEVISAVCLRNRRKSHTFYVVSEVIFRPLTEEEIRYYVNRFSPLDKAGAYGVQEWIGYIGVEAIRGSFYNVMGLPLSEVYSEMMAF